MRAMYFVGSLTRSGLYGMEQPIPAVMRSSERAAFLAAFPRLEGRRFLIFLRPHPSQERLRPSDTRLHGGREGCGSRLSYDGVGF